MESLLSSHWALRSAMFWYTGESTRVWFKNKSSTAKQNILRELFSSNCSDLPPPFSLDFSLTLHMTKKLCSFGSTWWALMLLQPDLLHGLCELRHWAYRHKIPQPLLCGIKTPLLTIAVIISGFKVYLWLFDNYLFVSWWLFRVCLQLFCTFFGNWSCLESLNSHFECLCICFMSLWWVLWSLFCCFVSLCDCYISSCGHCLSPSCCSVLHFFVPILHLCVHYHSFAGSCSVTTKPGLCSSEHLIY